MNESVTETLNRAGSSVREHIPGEREISRGIEHVKEVAKDAAHSVSEAATYVRQKADIATEAVGGAMEESGHYLREDGLNHIATDLTNLVRRHPIPTLLAGMAVGFLLAQATTGGRHSYPRRGEMYE